MSRAMVMMLLAWFIFCGPAWAVDLYHADGYAPLTSDSRSFKIGDALTVRIIEASSAETDATSSRNRSMQTTVGWQSTSTQNTAGASLNRQSNNTGSTARNGTLQAEITARVISVAPNGDLSVQGDQTITVNGEAQRIDVSGIVRPIDIAANNVVLSTRMSNARIDYSGRGFVDRSQRQDIVSRFLDFLGL